MSVIKRIQFDPEFVPVQWPRILERETLSGLEKAKEIIDQARGEALRIRQEAQRVLQEAVQEKEAERQRGYEEGREEGFSELTEKIVEAETAHEKILEEAEPQVIQMVMEIAEKVIGRELKKGAVSDIVRKAISQAVGKKVIVKVNPADLAVLKEKESELTAGLEKLQSLVFKEDEGIHPGGCLVETELGTVDARLETQIAAIKKALGLSEDA